MFARLLRAVALCSAFSAFCLGPMTLPASTPFPPSPKELRAPIPFEEMESFLREVDAKDHITVTEEGKSVEGRSIPLVRLNRGGAKATWRVFFIGTQHGDEPAGYNALLYMIRQIAEDPEALPKEVDLWILPLANPDGAVANRRTNSNKADLNRDHLTLLQPETRLLHAVHRRLMPHITVDCHEFRRDSGDYLDAGWTEWPLIMMDSGSNILFHNDVLKAGRRWVEDAQPLMDKAGYNYTRYFVGGLPPREELRYSTLVPDDARNGLGMDGGISFIIESGVYRGGENPNADLHERVEAYLTLLRPFLTAKKHFRKDIQAIEASRKAKPTEFLPTNYFWGSAGMRTSEVKVIDKVTSQTQTLRTANFMRDKVVKDTVPTPAAYAVLPQAVATVRPLLEAHGIVYSVLDKPTPCQGETVTLVRMEDEYDEVYQRFEGRTITRRGKTEAMELPAGTLLVSVDQALWRRVVLLLEPCNMYGLYTDEPGRSLAKAGEALPVVRVVKR